MRRKTGLLSLALLLGLLLPGCQKPPEVQPPGDTTLETSVVETDATLAGEDYRENSLTVLNIWATWCPACVAELPELQRVSETYQERGVAVIGVLQDGVLEPGVPDDEAIATAHALLRDAGVTYRIILPDEAMQTAFIDDMQYFPTTFFLDTEGTVIKTVVGSNDYAAWSKLIDEALEE